MPEETNPVAPPVDTPNDSAILPVASDTPPVDAAPEGPTTDDAEILADLRAARGEQPEAKEDGDDNPSKEETPTDDDDPNLIRMRGDYLTRLNKLKERENAIAERERALAEGGSQAAASAAVEPPASEPDAAPSADTAPTDLASEWAKTRGEIVAGWDEVEAPGEERLVAILDRIVPVLDQFQQFAAVQQEQQLNAQAVAIGQAAQSAVALVRDTYGIEVDPVALLGFAESGGLAAVAAARGIPLQSLTVDPEALLEAYEARNRSVLRAKPAGKSAPVETRQPVRDLSSGGGPRVNSEPLTETEEILADMQAARKGG